MKELLLHLSSTAPTPTNSPFSLSTRPKNLSSSHLSPTKSKPLPSHISLSSSTSFSSSITKSSSITANTPPISLHSKKQNPPKAEVEEEGEEEEEEEEPKVSTATNFGFSLCSRPKNLSSSHPSTPKSKPLPSHLSLYSSLSITSQTAASNFHFKIKKPPKGENFEVEEEEEGEEREKEDPHFQFREKVLYIDSLGLDFLSLVQAHPPIVSSSLSDIKSTVHFLHSLGFSTIDFRRLFSMCPDLLTYNASRILPVITFLLREAQINGHDLRRIINRRPRLLACDVHSRLRPTLYFLQMLGIADVAKHASLLSCSVEDKFIPRIEYLQRIGFSRRDASVMFRRFPQLFCYSIEENFEPKFDYFVVEMGRDLNELKEFPQYFSFSLEKRIKPRHQICVEKGVCLPLPVLLKTSGEQFRDRLDLCLSSSPPFKASPLWGSEDAEIAGKLQGFARLTCIDLRIEYARGTSALLTGTYVRSHWRIGPDLMTYGMFSYFMLFYYC